MEHNSIGGSCEFTLELPDYNDFMRFRRFAAWAMAPVAISAQVPDTKSLSGKYFFRELLVAPAASQTASISGTLSFDSNGGFTFQGQKIAGSDGPLTASGSGTYSVTSNARFVLSPDPLHAGSPLNGRIGKGALVASDTEGSNAPLDLLIAIPAAANGITNAAMSGSYQVATLEAPAGDVANIRDSFFRLTANGRGGLGDIAITGEIGSQRQQLNQIAPASTYSLNADGSGTINFPSPASAPSSGLVLSGTKNIYVSQDGSIFIGGGVAAGAHGMIIGIRTSSPSVNSTLNGIYFGGGVNAGAMFSFVGAAYATGTGDIIWSRRYLQSGNTAPLNVSALNSYSINTDGSGQMLADSFAVSQDGGFLIASGVEPYIANGNFELVFGVRAPALSGTGVFLNPLGIANAGSYAVDSPMAPGELITIFGTGFPSQPAAANTLPLPTTLGGLQVLLNGSAVPVLSVTPNQLNAMVPYGIAGPTAAVSVNIGGKLSNVLTVPVASSAPGVFTVASNGLGSAAILHPDYTLVSPDNPARHGETVQIFLTGLGAVSPPVPAGAAGPANPLSVVSGPVAVFIDHVQAPIAFQGLSPGLAALYQLNVTVPHTAGSGALSLAIETGDSFTDIATIPVR